LSIAIKDSIKGGGYTNVGILTCFIKAMRYRLADALEVIKEADLDFYQTYQHIWPKEVAKKQNDSFPKEPFGMPGFDHIPGFINNKQQQYKPLGIDKVSTFNEKKAEIQNLETQGNKGSYKPVISYKEVDEEEKIEIKKPETGDNKDSYQPLANNEPFKLTEEEKKWIYNDGYQEKKHNSSEIKKNIHHSAASEDRAANNEGFVKNYLIEVAKALSCKRRK
jgi:hypothetical protein